MLAHEQRSSLDQTQSKRKDTWHSAHASGAVTEMGCSSVGARPRLRPPCARVGLLTVIQDGWESPRASEMCSGLAGHTLGHGTIRDI